MKHLIIFYFSIVRNKKERSRTTWNKIKKCKELISVSRILVDRTYSKEVLLLIRISHARSYLFKNEEAKKNTHICE